MQRTNAPTMVRVTFTRIQSSQQEKSKTGWVAYMSGVHFALDDVENGNVAPFLAVFATARYHPNMHGEK